MKLVRFTSITGNTVLINPENVFAVEEDENKVVSIWPAQGEAFVIQGSIDEVSRQLAFGGNV